MRAWIRASGGCSFRRSANGHIHRGAVAADQPFAHLVQKGIPAPLPDAAPQVVYPSASHALAPAADFHLEFFVIFFLSVGKNYGRIETVCRRTRVIINIFY